MINFVQEIGPLKGKVTGKTSPDGLRGWRVDYDAQKGFHINWWDRTAGPARKDWRYGAITVEGKSQIDFYDLVRHGVTNSYP